ncbi:hypothetical protein NIES2111_25610 [Nostoc sp. NIES-2111]|uniref:hypothetical protein n=1 Tax=Nostoc sp. NIES-3756 TaxID=1751286 RepID=UPI000834B4E0|nr:hypothetical protein [Nostoc sp. NIES-3756]BAY38216.1 hypothetical protein NIES2111_25610 [Nostoc sp. NIES-2111]
MRLAKKKGRKTNNDSWVSTGHGALSARESEVVIEVAYSHCAGLDIHKKTVVAFAITLKPSGGYHKEIQTFGTMTSHLRQLLDWLTQKELSKLYADSPKGYPPVAQHNLLDFGVKG